MIKSGIKLTILTLLCFTLNPIDCRSQVKAPLLNFTLPKSDDHYKCVKDYVEDKIDSDYHHASAAAIEAFKDIKYGVRIHWGLYSIEGKGKESWPFLTLSDKKKQAYQDLYKTWNPKGFDAEEWMRLFNENGIKMFAITSMHHEGFSMFDTKAR